MLIFVIVQWLVIFGIHRLVLKNGRSIHWVFKHAPDTIERFSSLVIKNNFTVTCSNF